MTITRVQLFVHKGWTFVHISQTYCRFLHLWSASSSWLLWLVLAGWAPLLRYSRVRFCYESLVPCRLFSVWFTSSANFSCLDRIRHADRVFHRICALTVPPLSCVFPFFSSLPFVRVVLGISDFWGYKVQSSEDSSACAASARVPANPVRHSTGNGTSAFCVKPPPTALRIWLHFGFFFGRQ